MTDVQIDSSCLPPVQEVCRDFAVLEDGALAYCLQEQEIELHYASNIQKNQLVQNDLRMAKRLQNLEVEAQKLQDSRPPPKESPEGDPKNAQEDLQMKAGKDDRKKAKDKERVKRFHNLEKDESGQPKQRPSRGTRDGIPEALHWEMARLELQIQQQFQEDEELARKLQEEEEEEQTRMRARRNREQDDDYRAAQVAQDEEIARYLQDKELQTQWGSPRQERQQAEPPGLPERQSHCNTEKDSWLCGGRSPALLRIQTQEDTKGTMKIISGEKKPQFCQNIAEVLDPTFQATKMGTSSDAMDLRSKAPSPGPLAQTDSSSFDYPQGVAAPVFVSPTKRQPDKVGCPKSSNKKDGCRQQ
ncbi:coiled-coil domain-containing protein 50-like [Thamnophis elegans]|uniref:coiled-coil domain-containing protein 50-like n=1 Tax=Thamnophis elegans TaxID=35005 RepID=UPI0013771976|nr:coiled-coil domain-containing protein 50-like [Thamnophis elegans]